MQRPEHHLRVAAAVQKDVGRGSPDLETPARYLAEAGFRVRLICERSRPSPLSQWDGRTLRYDPVEPGGGGLTGRLVRHLRYAAKLLKARLAGCEVFLVCESPMCGGALLALLGVPARRIVYYAQNFIDPDRHPLHCRLEKLMCRRAGLVVSNEPGRARRLRSRYGLRDRPLVVRTAMPGWWPGAEPAPDRARRALGTDASDRLVLHLGPYAADRMGPQILGALARLPREPGSPGGERFRLRPLRRGGNRPVSVEDGRDNRRAPAAHGGCVAVDRPPMEPAQVRRRARGRAPGRCGGANPTESRIAGSARAAGTSSVLCPEEGSVRAIHCISRLRPADGGPSRSVPALVRALRSSSVGASLLCVGNGGSKVPGRDVSEHPPDPCPADLAPSRALKDRLLHGVAADVYHGHGLWQLPVHYMAMAARRKGAPYLIAPRGMLEPWARARNRWKKRMAGLLFQTPDLSRAACLHAVAPAEAAHFRDCGLSNPVAVIPNGVDLEEFDRPAARGRLNSRFPILRDRPFGLFLSRIHPKKGLPNLVRAWARLGPDLDDWLLVVAGPDTAGYRREVEELADEADVAESVVFTGPLYGAQKLAALQAAEIFVLPSYSEGFSVAVLEAMASRLPVLITPGCNFPRVRAGGAGFEVEPNPESLLQGLRRLMEAGPRARAGLGRAGRRLVERHYTWPVIASSMQKVYHRLVNGGPVPNCVNEEP